MSDITPERIYAIQYLETVVLPGIGPVEQSRALRELDTPTLERSRRPTTAGTRRSSRTPTANLTHERERTYTRRVGQRAHEETYDGIHMLCVRQTHEQELCACGLRGYGVQAMCCT